VGTWQPNKVLGYQETDRKICATTPVQVKATLGPFGPRQCGTFQVLHVATATPLARGAAPATLVTPVTVEVTGCPKDGVPAVPLVTVAPPKVELEERYTWRVTLSDSAPNPLVIKQTQPVKVVFVARTARDAAEKTATLDGDVTLEGAGSDPLPLQSASVGGWQRLACDSDKIHMCLGTAAGTASCRVLPLACTTPLAWASYAKFTLSLPPPTHIKFRSRSTTASPPTPPPPWTAGPPPRPAAP
jgi:hypothetical protein